MRGREVVDTHRLLVCVNDTQGRAPRGFMLWLKSVIGTALWCWWQVPARRYQRRVGALRAGLTLRSALAARLFL
jgi:hypothetical protein